MAGLNDTSGVSNDTIIEAEYLGSLGYSGSGASHQNFMRSYDLGPDSFGVHDMIDYYRFDTVGLTQLKIDIHPFGITQGGANYQAGIAYKIIAGGQITSVVILSDGGNQDGAIQPYLSNFTAMGYDHVIYEDFSFSPEFDDHLVIDIAPGTEVILEISSPGREIWDSEGSSIDGYESLHYIMDISARSGTSGGGDGGGSGQPTAPSTAGNDKADWLAISGDYDGGAGVDTVSFVNEYPPANALFSNGVMNWDITFENGAIVINGYHRFTNVERLEFSDGTLAFDTAGVAGQSYRIYQAAFDRTPDSAGLSYWIKSMDDGTALIDVAAGFIASAEFQSIYGSNPTDGEFVARLYLNVLGRDGEAAGIAYWEGELNSGLTKAQVLVGFSESAENISGVATAIADGIWYS